VVSAPVPARSVLLTIDASVIPATADGGRARHELCR
jgi:hypothetical protein